MRPGLGLRLGGPPAQGRSRAHRLVLAAVAQQLVDHLLTGRGCRRGGQREVRSRTGQARVLAQIGRPSRRLQALQLRAPGGRINHGLTLRPLPLPCCRADAKLCGAGLSHRAIPPGYPTGRAATRPGRLRDLDGYATWTATRPGPSPVRVQAAAARRPLQPR
ncbi:hypothetical protein SDC9_94974 [bioreactor metagenome]|uniref:Uncharacterized protein n=1 Tax=bioreactor metagenome TaxID=1076179 RepID=A0A645A4X8_9ZZZZ